ncbi:Hypothetical predicted protein, partial [Paramuricea clavata]
MSKQRRGSDMFSREAFLARLASKAEERENINKIANFVSAKNLRLSQLLEEKNEIAEETIFILSTKLTTKGLMTLAMAIKHVPSRYSQAGHDECGNFRLYAIGTIMRKAGFVIVVEDLRVYVTLVEARCPTLCSKYEKDFEDVLWKATEEESFNFNCMMTPPVDLCLYCRKPLSTNNKPNKATLFTLSGPIPCTKLRLRCRECDVQYGICSIRDKTGEHLYPKLHRPLLVEASNVNYVDAALYEWIPSLG